MSQDEELMNWGRTLLATEVGRDDTLTIRDLTSVSFTTQR